MRHCFPSLAQIAIGAAFAGGCAAVDDQPSSRAHPMQRGHVVDGRITLTGGNYKFSAADSISPSGNDDTSAGCFGLLVEGSTRGGIGGGLSLETMTSQDDLFENQTTSPAQAASVELAPFFLYRVDVGDRFQMPLRVGPWIHVLTLENQNTSDSKEWVSVGLRLAIEPEVVLARDERFEWTLFTALSLAAGDTTITLSSPGAADEDLDSNGRAFGLEIGPRFRWSYFSAGVSFLHRQFEASGGNALPGAVSAIDTTFNGIAFTFGCGF